MENKHLLVLLPFITIILKMILEDIKKATTGVILPFWQPLFPMMHTSEL